MVSFAFGVLASLWLIFASLVSINKEGINKDRLAYAQVLTLIGIGWALIAIAWK